MTPAELARRLREVESREHEAVQTLGDQIGYGRLMQLGEQIWRERLLGDGIPGGEHTVGPCAAMMVKCSHPVRDENGHCDICCGSGRVTKWVAKAAALIETQAAEKASYAEGARSLAAELAQIGNLLGGATDVLAAVSALRAELTDLRAREAWPWSMGTRWTVLYTNWRGETAIRNLDFYSLRFGTSQWHPEPQWLVAGFDLDTSTQREFALKDMRPVLSQPPAEDGR